MEITSQFIFQDSENVKWSPSLAIPQQRFQWRMGSCAEATNAVTVCFLKDNHFLFFASQCQCLQIALISSGLKTKITFFLA
jgi:hypothetical protein